MYLYYIDTHPMVHSIKKTVLNDFGFDLEAPSLIRVAAAAPAMTGRQARFIGVSAVSCCIDHVSYGCFHIFGGTLKQMVYKGKSYKH